MAYKYPIMVRNAQNLSASFTYYIAPQNSTNVAWTINSGFREMLVPCNMTLSNWYYLLGTAPGSGITRTFTMYKNGSSDNLTLAIADSNTTGTDLTNATSLSAGDNFHIAEANAGGVAASTTTNWSLYAICDNQPLFANTEATVTAQRWVGLQDDSGVSTSLAAAEQVMPTGGVIKNLYARLGSGTLASGSYTVTLYVNGSSTSLTCTLDSSNQQNSDTSHTVSVSAGDTVCWQLDRSSPSTNRTIQIGCEFAATTPGQGILMCTTGTTAVTHGTKSYSCFYNSTNVFETTESNKQAYGIDCTIKSIYAKLDTAPSAGHSRTIGFRQNGGDSALSVTISDANTTGSASTDVSVAATDLISISSIRSDASTADSIIKASLVFQADSADSSNMFLVF